MEVNDVKLLNQIPLDNNDNDDVLEQLIPLYVSMASDYCNCSFEGNIPAGVKKFVADCIKYGATGNIASRSMGTVSYSYVTDIPDSMYEPLKLYRKLSWGKTYV